MFFFFKKICLILIRFVTVILLKKQKYIKNVEQLNINLASDLKRKVFFLVKNSISIKFYKGLRKIKGLPVRGQRTHTNAKS